MCGDPSDLNVEKLPLTPGLRPIDVAGDLDRFIAYYSLDNICGTGTLKSSIQLSNGWTTTPLTDPQAIVPLSSETTLKSPTAAIAAPLDGATFHAGDRVHGAGTGFDPEDGDLTGSSLAWFLDGAPIGSGGKTVDFLAPVAPGSHVLKLRATDSNGQSNEIETTVTFNVTADTTPPVLTLTRSLSKTPWIETVNASDNGPTDTGLASVACSINGVATPLTPAFAAGPTYGPATFTVEGFGIQQVACTAIDNQNNQTTVVDSDGCLSGPEGTVLQPLDEDGTSVFKRGSTVPVKFRVCDAAGASISTPGTVLSTLSPGFVVPPGCVTPPPSSTDARPVFCKVIGPAPSVDEPVFSTSADTSFRFNATDQHWVFNMATSNLPREIRQYYIPLSDGSYIFFQFGVKERRQGTGGAR
jgi:hypothetical protein